MTTTVHSIKRQHGVAGEVKLTATVQSDGEEPRTVAFFGSAYGGPVVMDTGAAQVFVSDPGRLGEFGEGWVRRFFEAA